MPRSIKEKPARKVEGHKNTEPSCHTPIDVMQPTKTGWAVILQFAPRGRNRSTVVWLCFPRRRPAPRHCPPSISTYAFADDPRCASSQPKSLSARTSAAYDHQPRYALEIGDGHRRRYRGPRAAPRGGQKGHCRVARYDPENVSGRSWHVARASSRPWSSRLPTGSRNTGLLSRLQSLSDGLTACTMSSL
jgi:hypothetical protein